jgi:predicted Zn-dependent peptidase
VWPRARLHSQSGISKPVSLEADVAATTLLLSWPLVLGDQRAWTAAELALQLLTSTLGPLIRQAELPVQFSGGLGGGRLAPLVTLSLSFSDASVLPRAKELVREAIGAVANQTSLGDALFDFHAFRAGRASAINRLYSLFDDLNSRITFMAERQQWYRGGDLVSAMKVLSELDPSDVHRVARAMDPSRVSEVLITPTPGARRRRDRADTTYKETPDEVGHQPDLAAGPELSVPKRALVLQGLQQFTLPNGLSVILLPMADTPSVMAELTFRAGSARGDADGAGRAVATLALLGSNRQHWSTLGPQPSDRSHRGVLSWLVDTRTSTDADDSRITLRGPSHRIGEMMAGLARMVRYDSFDGTAFERYRAGRLPVLLRDGARLQRLWGEQRSGELFGQGHPYAIQTDVDAFRRLRLDDLAEFRTNYLVPNEAVLTVVGGIDPTSVRWEIETQFLPWRRGRPVPGLPSAKPQPGARCSAVIDDNEEVVHVGLDFPVTVTDSSRATLMVLTKLLGASAATLRSRQGVSYGFSAHLVDRVAGQGIQLSANVDRERAGEAVGSLLSEVGRTRDGKVSPSEVWQARRLAAAGLFLSTSSLDGILHEVSTSVLVGRPVDAVDRIVGDLARIDPAAMEAAARESLTAPKLTLFGPRTAVQAAISQVDQLGLDPSGCAILPSGPSATLR